MDKEQDIVGQWIQQVKYDSLVLQCTCIDNLTCDQLHHKKPRLTSLAHTAKLKEHAHAFHKAALLTRP